MIAWLIWAVRLSASSFMLLVSGLLVLFFFTTNDKALMAGLAAMFGLAGFFLSRVDQMHGNKIRQHRNK